MDGNLRYKLVKAGYAIYRMRDVYPIGPDKLGGIAPRLEIREMSQAKGQWGLYDKYPTKTAREQAWKELAKSETNLMEGCMSNRGDEWVEFAAQTYDHVETYTVPQFGDKPDDQVEAWMPEDCVRQIGKYIARFGKNQRGEEDQSRDMLKIAHFACIAWTKMRHR